MMFQSYALFPHMDVAGNIAFGLRQERMDRRRIAARVTKCWGWCRCRAMHDGARTNCPAVSASGSLRAGIGKNAQTVAARRAIGGARPQAAGRDRLELIGIQERVGITFLVVTHDQEEALSMARASP